MNKIIERIKYFVTGNTFWTEIVLALLMVAIFSMSVAKMANKRVAALRGEAEQLSAVRTSVERWQTSFETATPEENADWDNVQKRLQLLGVSPNDRLTLAQLVAQRAQDASGQNVIVKFTTADNAGAVTRSTSKMSFSSASYGLSMQITGDLEAVVDAIYSLPLSVDLSSVDIKRGDSGQATANVSLIVFEGGGA